MTHAHPSFGYFTNVLRIFTNRRARRTLDQERGTSQSEDGRASVLIECAHSRDRGRNVRGSTRRGSLWLAALSTIASMTAAIVLSQSSSAQMPPTDDAQDPEDVYDNNGEVRPKQAVEMIGDPVQASTGQLVLSDTDLELEGRGIDIEFTRHYRSGATDYLTLLGDRWCHSYDQKIILKIEPIEVHEYLGPQDAMYFPVGKAPESDPVSYEPWKPEDVWPEPANWGTPSNPSSSAPWWFTDQPMRVAAFCHDGTTSITKYERSTLGWAPEQGAFDKLNGTPLTYAGIIPFGGTIFVPPRSFSLRDKNGTVKTFAIGEPGCAGRPWITYRLTSIEDRNHNKVYLNYQLVPLGPTCQGNSLWHNFYLRLSQIIDTYRRTVNLTYANGWLSNIADSEGRSVDYTHDARGNLIVVDAPQVLRSIGGTPARAQKRYGYMTGATPSSPEWHYLTTVVAPAEVAAGTFTPYVVNEYTNGQVTRQQYGGTNASGVAAGGLHTFIYEVNTVNNGWFTESARTLSVDPNGNATLNIFDRKHFNRITYRFTGRLALGSGPLPSTSISYYANVNVSNPNHLTGSLVTSLSEYVASTDAHEPPVTCHTVRRAFNSDSQLVEEWGTDFHNRYVFDSASTDLAQKTNLLRVEQINTQNGTVRGTVLAYEPVYGQVSQVYSNRGLATGFSPPNGGSATPERYSDTFLYDYQESNVGGGSSAAFLEALKWRIDLSQASMITALQGLGVTLAPLTDPTRSNLGDINGDGVTSQSNGNRVLHSRVANVFIDPVVSQPAFTQQAIDTKYVFNDWGRLTAEIDPKGNATTYEYHSEAAPGDPGFPTTPPPVPGTGSFTLDSTTGAAGGGFQWKVHSPPAEATTKTTLRDRRGNVVTATDGRGFVHHATYNAVDKRLEMIDALGTYVRTAFDMNDRPVEQRIKNETPAFDGNGHPTGAMTTKPESRVVATYDILGHKVQSEVDAEAGITNLTRHRYDRNGNMVLVLKPEWTSGSGNVTATIFDEFDRPWRRHVGGVSAEFAATIGHADLGVLLSPTTIPQGAAVVSTFETKYAQSRAVLEIDAESHVTAYVLDGFNRTIEMQRPLGVTAHYAWDPDDNMVELLVEGPDGHGGFGTLSQEFTKHDEQGRVFQTDELRTPIANSEPTPDGPLTPGDFRITSRRLLDANGQITKAVDDNKGVQLYTYDGLDRLTQKVDEAGNSTVLRYDRNGNTIQLEEHEVTSAGGTEVRTTYRFYDEVDRLVAECNAAGETRRVKYDTRGNAVFTSDANGSVVASLPGLDTHGEHGTLPTLAINDDGNTEIAEFDLASRRTATHKHLRAGGIGSGALQSTISLTTKYDRNSRVVEMRDGKNNPTTIAYDGHDRETSTTFSDGTNKQINSYDRNGLVLQSTDANGTIVDNVYDDLLRIGARHVTPGPGVGGTIDEQFLFDGLGRLTRGVDDDSAVERWYDTTSYRLVESLNGKQTVTHFDGKGNNTEQFYPGGRALKVFYDQLDRPVSIADNTFGWIVEYAYTGFSRVAKRDFLMNNTSWALAYDTARHVVYSEHTYSGVPIIDARSSTWDRESNRLTRHNVIDGVDHQYAYDSVNRMLDAGRTAIQAGSITYRLDKAGNRTSAIGSWNPGPYTTAGTDGPVHQYTTTPFDQRAYDNNGNLVHAALPPAQGGASIANAEYDYRNQLIRHTGPTLTTDYAYDVLGRRTSKTISSFLSTDEIRYYYNGERICEERDAFDQVLATYVHGYYIDEVLTMQRYPVGSSPEDYWYHSDDQFNVVALTDRDGNVVERYDYGDFGSVLDGTTYLPFGSSAVGNTFFFTGRQRDEESGWYYYRSRYMDPAAGRFLSRDTIGIWGDPAALGNGYTYCGNNPWSYVDPLGTDLATPSWSNAWDYVKGVGKGAFDKGKEDIEGAAKGAKEAVTHPIDTGKGMLEGAKELGGMVLDGDAEGILRSMYPEVMNLVDALNSDKVYSAEDSGYLLGRAAVEVLEKLGPGAIGGAGAGLAVKLLEKVGPAGKVVAAGVKKLDAAPGGKKSGGRLGNEATQAHVRQVAQELEDRGWKITGGGGKLTASGDRLPEEHLPSKAGGRKGGNFVDITATKDGKVLRINTIDTKADGVTPTKREASAAASIRSKLEPGEHLILIPKPK